MESRVVPAFGNFSKAWDWHRSLCQGSGTFTAGMSPLGHLLGELWPEQNSIWLRIQVLCCCGRGRGASDLSPQVVRPLRVSSQELLADSQLSGKQLRRLSKGRHNFYIFLCELALPFGADYDVHLSPSPAFGA